MRPSQLVIAHLGVALALGAWQVSCSPREGSACNREGAGRCLDTSRALTCRGGLWQPLSCRGGAGCQMTADSLQCDQGAAREGEACVALGQRACSEASATKPAALVCLQSTAASAGLAWAREVACLGPRGCRVEGATVTCDDSRASVGELCARAGQLACDVGGAALLSCQDGRFAVEGRACAHCTSDGDAGISCD